MLDEISILSCVSGGSIVGALYALHRAGRARRGQSPNCIDDVIAELRPVLSQNLRGRAFFGTFGRALRTVASWTLPTISRIGLIAEELGRRLYHEAALSEAPPFLLINATNLRTGKGWKFFRDRVGDYIVGATEQTARIPVAHAVAASAAYPGLVDAYRFQAPEPGLRPELLDERWGMPRDSVIQAGASWRERYRFHGKQVMPLVDGGAYDNEGLIGLRSAGVTHAIISTTTPPDDDADVSWWVLQIPRMVEVIHSRLGGATRQLGYEMTHGVDPNAVRQELRDLAAESANIAADETVPASRRQELRSISERALAAADVGLPKRGHQFTAMAPILLNRVDVASNTLTTPDGGSVDIPRQFRGCDAVIVRELSRVRTDLDALDPRVVNLLMAQGYYVADAYCRVSLGDLLRELNRVTSLSQIPAPSWQPAESAIQEACSDSDGTITRLRAAQKEFSVRDQHLMGKVFQVMCGQSLDPVEALDFRMRLAIVASPFVLALLAAIAWLLYGLYVAFASVLR